MAITRKRGIRFLLGKDHNDSGKISYIAIELTKLKFGTYDCAFFLEYPVLVSTERLLIK